MKALIGDRAKQTLAAVSCLAALSAGCAGDADSGPEVEGEGGGSSVELGAAYVLAQEITDGESRETLITILDGIGSQTIDRSSGLTVPGRGEVFAALGYVFVLNAEDFTLTRYSVSAERALVDPVTVSFAGLGVTRVRDFFMISPERAYATNDDGTIIVFDPTEMAIIEDVPIRDIDRGGFLGRLSPSGGDATQGIKGAMDSGYLTFGITWVDFAEADALPELGVLSISTTDARDQRLMTTGCSSVATWVLSDESDNTYVLGTPAWGPYLHHAETDLPAARSCAWTPRRESSTRVHARRHAR